LTDADETGEKAVALLIPPLPMKTTNSKVETLMVMVNTFALERPMTMTRDDDAIDEARAREAKLLTIFFNFKFSFYKLIRIFLRIKIR